jgi:hypothetical protein
MSAFDRFLRVVEDMQELSEPEQYALADAAKHDEFETMVFFSPLDSALQRRALARRAVPGESEPAQIWAYQEQQLFILRQTTLPLTVAVIPLDHIVTFEYGEILLSRKIESVRVPLTGDQNLTTETA